MGVNNNPISVYPFRFWTPVLNDDGHLGNLIQNRRIPVLEPRDRTKEMPCLQEISNIQSRKKLFNWPLKIQLGALTDIVPNCKTMTLGVSYSETPL